MKKTIDIKELEKSCPQFELLSNWVPRKIITEINKERNVLRITNPKHNYGCIVVGFEIFGYLLDTPLFSIKLNSAHPKFECVGALSSIDVYIERYGLLNGNEIEFFNETKEYLKPIYRQKKLERILNEESI